CDLGVRIFERRNDAGDARSDDRVGAWRRLAVVRARLERDVECGAARGLASAAQCLDLRMRPAPGLGPAAADNPRRAVIMAADHGAYGGIGPSAAKPAPAQRQRQRHESAILLATLIAGAHLRAISAASSADSSASAVSKSLASRKLR